MQETYWQKRLAEPKGWVEYNPNETFVIHVQWVVANRAAADEMLAALHRCAEATLRDAPPVVSYFFRISHDQRLAESKFDQISQNATVSRLLHSSVQHHQRDKGF